MTAALFMTLRPPSRNFGILINATMLLYAVGIVLYALAFSFEHILVVEVLLGVAGQLRHICALIGFQLDVPEEMRGRVLSIVFTLAQLGFIGGVWSGCSLISWATSSPWSSLVRSRRRCSRDCWLSAGTPFRRCRDDVASVDVFYMLKYL